MYSATGGEADKSSSSTSAHSCRRFSLADIQSATKDFDDEMIIGEGGSAKVYKGQISSEETGHVVAIKRLKSKSDQEEEAPEFRAEIEMLSKLRHCHLVSLIGYCDDNKEMILVYEYMPHGTLYDHLHKADTPLNWVQRLKIAIGAGRGLDYLHTGVGTQYGIIHRDVKSSNILLDENWAAMISDFGLSKIGPTNQSSSYVYASVKGTFGYLDPEYFYTRKLTRKTDVYAFGVVLFELLSGRLPVDIRYGEEQCSLVRWAKKCVKERKLNQMVDSNIRGTIAPKCLRRFAQIADRCLYSVPKERPSMAEVVVSLQALLELQQKCDNSADSSGTMGFTWKIHKYLVSATKENSDQSGTSSPTNLENNMNQCFSTNKDGRDHGEMPHRLGQKVARDLKMFTFDEVSCATRGFAEDTCLGVGSYPVVYKGWVDKTTYSPSENNTGMPVVIKSLRYNKFVELEKAKLELEMLKQFRHPNLVKLIGYCLEGEQLFLVYEFMLNGNFQDLLHSGAVARLPLVTKVKIAVGIARGINFLGITQDEVEAYPWTQTVSESRLDRHKILLDEDFTPKLSDYDVAKLVYGHYPYNIRANNLVFGDYYPGFGTFPLQSNLSGFTVVLAELLTGKQISNETEFQKIDGLLRKGGKKFLSLIAKLCFEICNEVDSESKMLRILVNYEKYIPAYD